MLRHVVGRGDRLRLRSLFSLFLLCLVAAQAASAQAEGYRLGPVYTENFPEISLVLDVDFSQSGGAVGIRQSEITLLEEGVASGAAVSLEEFRATRRGMAIVLCVDVSGRMRGDPLDAVRQALRAFAAESTPADKVALVTFAEKERLEVPFQSPPDALPKAIDGLRTRGAGARLYQAVHHANGMFSHEPGLPRRRRILVISGGKDEGSEYSLEEILRLPEDHSIPIDAIALASGRSDPRALSDMERLSGSTGGNYSFAAGADQLRRAAVNGIRWLQASPVAIFQLRHIPPDGARHTIAVRWTRFPGAREATILAPASRPTSPWLIAAAVAAGILALSAALWLRRRYSTKKRPAADPDPR